MSIRIQLSPFLRKYVPEYKNGTGILLPFRNKITVGQIISKLNIPKEEVISIIVNGYPGKYRSVVDDGDSVTLAKVIGGG